MILGRRRGHIFWGQVVGEGDEEHPFTQERLDERMGDTFETYGKSMPIEVLVAWELMWKGGKCPRQDCNLPFLPSRVVNAVYAKDKDTGEVLKNPDGEPILLHLFADFTMYVPGCRCYKKCERAGTWVELAKGKRELSKNEGCGSWLVAERLLQDHKRDLSGTGVSQRECLSCGGWIL